MVEVFALEDEPRPTGELAHPFRLEDRGRTTGVVALETVEFVQERVVGAGLLVLGGDLLDHCHQGLGHVPSAVHAEVSSGVGVVRRALGDSGAGSRQIATLEDGFLIT